MIEINMIDQLKEIIKCKGNCSGYMCFDDCGAECLLYKFCTNSSMITLEKKCKAAKKILEDMERGNQ